MSGDTDFNDLVPEASATPAGGDAVDFSDLTPEAAKAPEESSYVMPKIGEALKKIAGSFSGHGAGQDVAKEAQGAMSGGKYGQYLGSAANNMFDSATYGHGPQIAGAAGSLLGPGMSSLLQGLSQKNLDSSAKSNPATADSMKWAGKVLPMAGMAPAAGPLALGARGALGALAASQNPMTASMEAMGLGTIADKWDSIKRIAGNVGAEGAGGIAALMQMLQGGQK